jgi:catechol 2,3-dioxygenase-like lactoylglutathione lyase family enzyme
MLGQGPLSSAELVAFVPSTDLERSREFYVDVLGLDAVEMTQYASVLRSGPTTLRITLVGGPFVPQSHTVLGWVVPDIAQALADLRERGVTTTRYGGMAQDALGVWTTPDGSKVAWFTDPDGSTLSFTELTELS